MFSPHIHTVFQRTVGNIRRHFPLFVIFFVALTACWIPLGCFTVAYRIPHHLKPSWMDASGALIALRTTASIQDAQRIADLLKSRQEVEDISIVPPGEAMRQLRDQLRQWGSLLDDLPDDSLPPFLMVHLRPKVQEPTGENLEAFLEGLKESHPVDDILYGGKWEEKLGPPLKGMELLGLTGIGLLAVAAVAVMALATHLIVLVHGEELAVYRLVGASMFFTRAPFYLEAAFLGALSGTLASMVVLGTIKAAHTFLPIPLAAVFSWNTGELIAMAALFTGEAAVLAGLGCRLAFQLFPETT